MNYPHYVQNFDHLKGSRFVGFFMDDSDIEKIHEIFPNGCWDGVDEYSICPSFHANHTGLDPVWSEKFHKLLTLKKDCQIYIWDVDNLLHDGYWPMFCRNGNTYTLVCGKGKIKPNKHTKIVLLDKVPNRVAKLFQALWENYAIPMINIVESAE